MDHYKPRKISQITKTDSKISVIGKVVETGENSFVLSDDTGRVEIASDEPVEKEKLIRVFCSRVEGKLKADVIQDLKGLDLNLYKRVDELYNRAGLSV